MTPEEMRKAKPFNYAPITFIEGEQGSGKTETAVTRVVDPTFSNMTSVRLGNGLVVKAEPVLNDSGYAVIGYGKLWLPNQPPKIMRIPPKSCVIADSVRIVYNGHLYGIRYVHLEMEDIIDHLNDGTLTDCYLVVDEGYLAGDRREGLSPLVKTITKLGWQIRKRHIFLIMCLPDSSVLDLRLQKIETEHIVCSYDIDTQRITMFIRNRKKYKKSREVTYDGRIYRKYYDTDEHYEISEVQIERAKAMAQ